MFTAVSTGRKRALSSSQRKSAQLFRLQPAVLGAGVGRDTDERLTMARDTVSEADLMACIAARLENRPHLSPRFKGGNHWKARIALGVRASSG